MTTPDTALEQLRAVRIIVGKRRANEVVSLAELARLIRGGAAIYAIGGPEADILAQSAPNPRAADLEGRAREVSQSDREAAAAGILKRLIFQHGGEQPWMDASTASMRMGEQDDHYEVVAFRDHRIAALSDQAHGGGAGEELGRLRETRDQLQRELSRMRTVATDRRYMMEALAQMLGPKGREVWCKWQEQGLQRVHFNWTEQAEKLSGEEIAQVHIDMELAVVDSVPLDLGDAIAAISAQGEGGAK